MRQTRIFLLLFLLVAAWSCKNKELFDKELYRYYVKTTYPVDTLEEDHPWTLLTRHILTVTANVNDSTIRELRIFSTLPSQAAQSEMVAQSEISAGGTATVVFDVAQTQGVMYAGLMTRSGKYYIMPFNPIQTELNFNTSQMMTMESLPSPLEQTFTYLFESSFPTPEDFDYNDVVMRISRRVPQANLIQLRVTLSAVGTNSKVAGAIRLPGVRYDDVDRVTIVEGNALDYDYPVTRTLLDTDEPLARSRNGEAVVCLFEDAHWALKHEQDVTGIILHEPYNTEIPSGKDDNTVILPAQTRTYNVFLKKNITPGTLLLADIDPFIIETNTLINFEVHTYKYKFEEVLWIYLGNDKRAYDDFLAWALLIPDASFGYPVEEVPLGTFRNKELYGAYGQWNHSFGQWARNYRIAFDWWQYPNKTLVIQHD